MASAAVVTAVEDRIAANWTFTPFLDLKRTLSILLHRQRYRGAVLEAFLASL